MKSDRGGLGKRKVYQTWTADEQEALRQGIQKCVPRPRPSRVLS